MCPCLYIVASKFLIVFHEPAAFLHFGVIQCFQCKTLFQLMFLHDPLQPLRQFRIVFHKQFHFRFRILHDRVLLGLSYSQCSILNRPVTTRPFRFIKTLVCQLQQFIRVLAIFGMHCNPYRNRHYLPARTDCTFQFLA